MRIIGFGILPAVALCCLATPSRVSAWCQSTTEPPPNETQCPVSGEKLTWTQSCLTYAIDDRGSQWFTANALQSVIDESFQTWLDVRCSGESPDIELQALQNSTCQKAEFNNIGNVNTVAFLTNWVNPDGEELDPKAFAVTSVWHTASTGKIVDADIMVNETLGPYATCPSSGCTDGNADLPSILTHEIGHFFGIGHSSVRSATMHFQQPRKASTGRVLNADDEEAICTIYAPGSLGSKCDFNPIGGLDLDCEDTASFTTGCVTREADGSCSTLPEPIKGKSGCAVGSLGHEDDSQSAWQMMTLAAAALIVSRRRFARLFSLY